MNKQELEREINMRIIGDVELNKQFYVDSGLEIALSLINQLDEPEITEEQALNKLAESYPFSADGINGILQAQLAGYSPVSTMKFIQSNEPKLFAEEVQNE